MKTNLPLFCLVIFVFACYSFNTGITSDVKKYSSVLVHSSAMPSSYSFVDTIPVVDSIALIEPEEPTDPLDYMTIEEKGMIDESIC